MPPRKKKLDMQSMMLEIAERLQESSRAPNIKKYTPHEKQAIFHKSPKKKKLYIGGNRSGKTTGGVTEGIWRATCTHPYRPELNAIGPNRGRVAAVDFIQGIDKIILPQYAQWVYPSAIRGGAWETAYDKGAKTLYFSNGSFIEFMSYDQDLDKFAGTSRHWVHFDEEPPKPIFGECRARLVDTNGEYWITMTPVEGMTWIYDDLYEKNVNNPEGDVLVIEINTLENPFLTEEGIRNLMEGMDDDEITTRVGGGFVRQGGRVYKNFDPAIGGVHVLPESIKDPKTYFPTRNWLWILALDHGLNNPTAVLWAAVNDDGFVVLFDEWYKSELTIDQHAEVIKRKIKQHGRYPDLLVADPAIKQRNPVTGASIQQEYQKYGLSFTLGNNDVPAGVIRVKRYLKPVEYVGPKAAIHPLFGGTKELLNATDDVVYRSRDGRIPRLLLDPRCEKVIWEAKRYRWKTYADKKKQFENNPYDEPHKKDDHAMDALRYLIMTRPDLIANDNTVTEDQARDAMTQLGHKLTAVANYDMDDPRGLLERDDWNPLHPTPNNDGDFTVDEHMGGIW